MDSSQQLNDSASPFALRLQAFLDEQRSQKRAFVLGHWLKSLDDDQLKALGLGAAAISNQADAPDTLMADVVAVARLAWVAETGKVAPGPGSGPVLMTVVQTLRLAVTYELLVRKGAIELSSTLSIKPHKKITLRLTSLGLAMGLPPEGGAQ